MIANFFRSLEQHGVAYLLISGQATVLYGAATFSEDIDLWIEPAGENRDRFLAALRDSAARYYKLTPPFTLENLRRGHGFHFLLPDREGEFFLDVMGAPPRVRSFAETAKAARRMDTEWGKLQTIGIPALVELKKTQRLEDYPIISKLALAWFDQPECANREDDLRWAFENIFTLPELAELFHEQPAARDLRLSPPFSEFAEQARAGAEISDEITTQAGAVLQRRIAALQQADRRYWREIVAELKWLRATGKLMAEGTEV